MMRKIKSVISVFILIGIVNFSVAFAFADYGLLLSSHRTKEKAVEYARSIAGFEVNIGVDGQIFIEKIKMAGTGIWYRVCRGPFDTHEEAIKTKDSTIESVGSGSHAIVVKVDKLNFITFELEESVSSEAKDDNVSGISEKKGPSLQKNEKISVKDNQTPSAEKELLQESFFGLLAASYRNKDLAIRDAEKKSKTRQSVYVEKITMSTGIWFRVCLGPFKTESEARIASKGGQRNRKAKSSLALVTSKRNRVLWKDLGEKSYTEKTPAPISLKKKSGNADGATVKGKKNVEIQWEKSKSIGIKGYKIYYDTKSGVPYEPDREDYLDEGASPITVGAGETKKTLHGLREDRDYYFSVTSFNAKGGESEYTPEIIVKRTGSAKIKSFAGKTRDIPVSTPTSETRIKPDKMRIRPRVKPGSAEKAYKKIKKRNAAATAVDKPDTGLIAPGDIIKVNIPGQKEMSRNYDVDPEGNIYLLIIGKLTVVGLSEQLATEKLAKAAAALVTKGEVPSVRIIERKRYVNVEGGIRYPGWYRLDQEIPLKSIIRQAGGFLPGAERGTVSLLRKVGNDYREVPLTENFVLRPDDTVKIPMPEDYEETADSGDLLFISIPQRQAPSRQPDRVDSADLTGELIQNKIEVDKNGYIYLPGYGHLKVEGLTALEIREAINKRLPVYIAKLKKVQVSIVEKKHYIQIMGHVATPGIYNIPESSNIQEAVGIAGGITDGAVTSDCVIQRSVGDRIEHIKVNLYQFTITGDRRLLTPLHKRDIFFTPITSSFGNVKRTLDVWTPPQEKLEKDIKSKVRIMGAVHNPGMYEVQDDMNLLDLMVLASGDNQWAELSDILIIRNDRVAVKYNLEEFFNKFHEGVKPLPKIEAGDTVYLTRIETTTREARERVYVLGNVLGPGSYELYDNMTVLQALAWAGGLNEWADRNNITIVRMVNGEQQNINFSYDDAVRGRAPAKNIRMFPNDVLVVH